MSKMDATKGSPSKVDIGDIELSLERKKRYRVLLDGVRSDVETADSFALKFSILASLPITKVQHIMKSFPATMWVGTRKPQAAALLDLIEESGGEGRIVEEDYSPDMERVSGGGSVQGKNCVKCGFPLKKEDLFCNFCMTPIQETTRESVRISVPRKPRSSAVFRSLFLLLVAVTAVILVIVLRG